MEDELINDRMPRAISLGDQASAAYLFDAVDTQRNQLNQSNVLNVTAAKLSSALNYHVNHHSYLQPGAAAVPHHHHINLTETVDYQDIQQLVGQRRVEDELDSAAQHNHQQIVEQISLNAPIDQVSTASTEPSASHASGDALISEESGEIVISDVPVESRARASLPVSYLYIEEVLINQPLIDDGAQIDPIFGVFARKSIPQRTQFGPVEGVILQFSGTKPHSPQPNLIVFISDSLILDQR